MSKSYNILAVEDEPMVAKRVLRLSKSILGEAFGESHTVATITDSEKWLADNDVDLIFLDLNLTSEDGFDLIRRFSAKAAHTIIISAETSRAIEAFDYGVLDFVSKPFTEKRLSKALARFTGDTLDKPSYAKLVSFNAISGIETYAVSDILYFQAADKYSEATLATGGTKFHGKSLNRLEDLLSEDFLRTHKSYLVQRQAIKSIKSLEGSRYELHLNNGQHIPIGRTRIEQVRQALESA